MEVDYVAKLISDLGFPIVVAGGAIWFALKSNKERESKMWDTITGFQTVLTKFDSTLRDVSFGLKEVKQDVDSVKRDVAEIKNNKKED